MTQTMMFAGFAALMLAAPAMAEITVTDAYVRSAMPGAPTGAAFMVIENTGPEPDRLIDVRSDVAAKVELHTHLDQGGGVMKMVHVEEGFALPAGDVHRLARGGDHVMFMGLKQPLVQGETVTVTLVFEKAGERVVEIPVDLDRQESHGMMQHGMTPSN
ncbi:copper chaperone PCu(A)C [Tropicibacter sp. S64]|uniref:copper chaperone PCu(A)C n=1 Tax=Tropicibacter sp. S64 TaxID=3415122 RepID=UPI003C7E076D